MAANRALKRPEGQGATFPGPADQRDPAAAPTHSPLLELWSLSPILRGRCEAPPEAATIARWVISYLMRPHAELSRFGDVCPFMAQRRDWTRSASASAILVRATRSKYFWRWKA